MDMQRCIDDCLACFRACTETIQHCLQKGGRHAEAAHIRLLQDCADVCELSAELMMRRSELHARTCAVCAEACQRCAEGCERLADDDHMRRCAQICRRCAESCRHMSMLAA